MLLGDQGAFYPEADKIKECWMDRRLNEESNFIPTFSPSKKLSETGPESESWGQNSLSASLNAMDTAGNDAGQTWTKVSRLRVGSCLARHILQSTTSYIMGAGQKGDAYDDRIMAGLSPCSCGVYCFR